jgi:hypothetical protein
MTSETKDDRKAYVETIASLEDALDSEKREAQTLKKGLGRLEQKLSDFESRFEQRYDDAVDRAAKAEGRVKDLSARLELLGTGREESLLALKKMEQELKLVVIDRDSLREELKRVEGMQTETATFDESEVTGQHEKTRSDADLPSIDELMANFGADGDDDKPRDGFGQAQVDDEQVSDEADWQEMIPAEAIVAGAPGDKSKRSGGFLSGKATRSLIRVDCDPPQEFPLGEQLMTIGRSESADIPIDGDFISRIHARVLMLDADIVLEDAGSKNGTKVNGSPIDRCTLKHDDIVRVGSVSFKFYDANLAR